MNTYSITLFFHIVGAVGFFVALGLEWTGLSQIRSGMNFELVRNWMGLLQKVRKVGFLSMLTTVITGVLMMVMVWGRQSWLIVTVGALILMIALAQAVTAPRMRVIGQALAAGKGTLPANFRSLANGALLLISIQTRVAIALGIIFLKLARPDLGGSLLTIGVAVVLGLAVSLPISRREGARERTEEGSVH